LCSPRYGSAAKTFRDCVGVDTPDAFLELGVVAVDVEVDQPFHLIWRKDNFSPALMGFVAQVKGATLTADGSVTA